MDAKNISIGLLGIGIAVLAACAPGAISPAPPPLSAVKSAPTPAQAPLPADAISVAKAYVNTANSGNFDQALAFYADDAITNTGVGVFIGKAEIAQWLANDVKTTRASPRDWTMQGALVVNTGTVTLDRFTKAGIGAVEYHSEFLIGPTGKIRYFGPTVTLTPDQQQKMRAAQADAPLSAAAGVNPGDVVKAYVAAANSGDFDKTYAFYADDSGALVMNGTLLLTNKQQIGDQWLKNDVTTTRATIQDARVNGDVVTVTGTVSLDRFKRLGINSIAYSAEYVISGGKIRFFYPTLQFTADQMAKIQSAQQPQAAPTR